MVLFRVLSAALFASSFFASHTLFCDNGQDETVPVPELLKPQETKEEPSKSTNTIVYDSSWIDSGFMNDTGVNRGLPRYFNGLELAGYLRMRMNYFRNPHLGTYVPGKNLRTSNFLPDRSFIDGQTFETDPETNPAFNNFGANMRLRLDPTIHISQTMRVRTTVDVLDNQLLGSNPGSPHGFMALSQVPPASSIIVRRAWAEARFPASELRFGRMPFHFGLGILYNSGEEITSDYHDTIDGILFSSRIGEVYVTPGYSIAYSAPHAPGGRYPQESSALTHVFLLSLVKRDSEFLMNLKREEGNPILNYGLLTSYRRQYLDYNTTTVKRNAHIGLGSLWAAFGYKTFHIETELAGVFGKYTSYPDDLIVKTPDKRDMWLLSGGVALESRYGFLEDRLQLGLDAGLASGQNGPGFGIHEDKTAEAGDIDGAKIPGANKYKTNFKFNPGYGVDLLLHREILGTVASTAYFKPHLTYFFSRNFGLRGDVITTLAPFKSNTAGNSNWLGVELDGNAFIRADNGMYFSLAYGLLFPLEGLNHRKERLTTQEYADFGTASTAQTLQLYFGLTF